jgi:hypothetical protein
MASFRIPYLVGKTNKSSVTNWYWQPSAALKRDGWAPLPLGAGGAPDDPPEAVVAAARKQNAAFAEWKKGGTGPSAVRPVARAATVSALIRMFIDEGWPSVERPGHTLAPNSQRQYATMFRVLEAWAGDVALTSITPERVAVLRDALMQPAKTGPRAGKVRHTSAHATLRVGRTLFAYAAQKRLIARADNPFIDFALAMPAPRNQIWSAPAREALLETTAQDPGLEAAITLAYCTAQREADLLRLSISQYVRIPEHLMGAEDHELLSQIPVPAWGGHKAYVPGDVWGIRLRQSKTKTWVEVPVVGADRARIEAAIARARAANCTTLLMDERAPAEGHHHGRDWRPRPWTSPSLVAGQTRFIRRFAELRENTVARLEQENDALSQELAREIRGLQFRDFRRTAVVVMGEFGIADHLIAAITGHDLDETKKILDTYMPRTTGMAARAIALSHARAGAEGATARRRGGEAG